MSVPTAMPVDFQQVFNALPGLSLVLAPDAPRFTVLAVTDAYVRASGRQRHELLGRGGLELRPGASVPLGPITDSAQLDEVRASMDRAIASEAPDSITFACPFAIWQGPAKAGAEEPSWRATHTPVFDAEGDLSYLIQQFDVVTGARASAGGVPVHGAVASTPPARERWLGHVAHAMPQLVWTANDQGSVSYCNARAADYAGLDPRAEVGWAWRLAVHPDDIVSTERAWSTALGGDEYQHTHRLRMADGTYRWHLSRAIRVAFHDGASPQWIGTATDIHDLHAAQVALREREAVYRSIGETIDYGVWVCAPDGRNTYASESFLRLVGMTQEHCSDFGWGDVLHPDDAEATIAAWQECVRTGQTWDRQHRFRGTDGDWHHVLARGVPVRNERGEIVSWAGINLDIGHLKDTEEALRTSEQRMRLATEATEVGIWEWNVTAGTLRWDAQMFRIYGIAPTPDGLVDERMWSHAVLPEDLPHQEAILRDTVRRGGRSRRQFRMRRADTGECREVEAVETVRADRLDSDVWVVGTNLDVTDRVRTERDLRDADRRKDEFLATLAHELRNPLVPVRNAVHALRLRKWSQPDVQWGMDVIDRQVRHLTRLIDDLMDVSRISRQRIELRREQVDLAQSVREAIEACRSVIDAGGHDITVTLPPGPLMVDADPTRLTQVFQNLLNNAAKYTERNGRLHVHVLREGDDAVVSVTDSGIGIPADRLPTIFAMFSQVEGTVSRSQGGLGIGLHLVKWLVEMHGGEVEARSDGPGTGSTFVVRLPIVDTRSTERAGGDACEGTPAVADLRVLVVDDNTDGADTSAILLQLMGYTVSIANDGEMALQVAGEFRPDVVLLDLGLPKVSGYDVARALRQQPWGQAMVIVAVTGWGQDDDKRRSEEAGFDHHLVKPVDPQVLMQLLGRLGERRAGA